MLNMSTDCHVSMAEGVKKIFRKYPLAVCLLSLVSMSSSCIRDEIPPCPPLQIEIAVKDKNYFNVDKVELEEKLATDLPLRSYVPTLYYRLSRLMPDGSVVMAEEKGVFSVEGDDRNYPLTFDESLPHGTYIITVWGGLDDLSPLSDDRSSITFHPGNREGNDVYMTNDTVVYDAYNNFHTVELERTKGKLIVQSVGLPDDISIADKRIEGLYGIVRSHKFLYSDRTEVGVSHKWQPAEEVVTKTVLAPSVGKNASLLHIDFFDDESRQNPVLSPEPIPITVNRNYLTVLKYVYEGDGNFSIYILINDSWERVHGMIVD